ncbi:MAG: hypothetical protein KBS74_06980 [Clostridiales bacterium]|nr:hypothetical protein [Candidatus Cacconaster stercorequi]
MKTNIEKNAKNIISCSITILILVTLCWFYEPIVQAPMPAKLANILLTLFMTLSIAIIANASSILKKQKTEI